MLFTNKDILKEAVKIYLGSRLEETEKFFKRSKKYTLEVVLEKTGKLFNSS